MESQNITVITIIILAMLFLLIIRFLIFYKRQAAKYFENWQYTQADKVKAQYDLSMTRKELIARNKKCIKLDSKNRKKKTQVNALRDMLDWAEFETAAQRANVALLEKQLIDAKENFEASKILCSSLMNHNDDLNNHISRKHQPRKKTGEFDSVS